MMQVSDPLTKRATAADRRRWDELHASQAVARAAYDAVDARLSLKYGANYERAWVSRGERGELERAKTRENKVGDKIVELLVRISPRGHAWLSGAPSWWIRYELTWEDAVRPAGEPLSVVVPAPFGASRGLTEASADDWEDYLAPGEARYVPEVVLPQMPNIVARAREAGMPLGSEYVGAGMTSVVFCAGDVAFKVARQASPTLRRMLGEEAEWLAAAESVPTVAPHVARLQRFDPSSVVIVRDCPHPDRDQSLSRWESRLHDLHRAIERSMLPHGWTAPEFKPDSYVLTTRGPVLVDASMPSRVGGVLARYVEQVAAGERELGEDSPSDLAFYVRREVGQTLTQADAERLQALLERRWPGSARH